MQIALIKRKTNSILHTYCLHRDSELGFSAVFQCNIFGDEMNANNKIQTVTTHLL